MTIDSAFHKTFPVRFIASILWVGFLLAISFMEAPLKFQAPSVSLAIGLDIGRIVFGALNKIEWVLLILIIISFMIANARKTEWILLSGITIILLIQTLGILPVLDARAESIIAGEVLQKSSIHLVYIILEISKTILLITSSYQFIYINNNDPYEIQS